MSRFQHLGERSELVGKTQDRKPCPVPVIINASVAWTRTLRRDHYKEN